jgi:hypothetical protein
MIELKKKQKTVDPNKLNRAKTTEFANELISIIESKNLTLEQQIAVLRRTVKIKLVKRRK